MSTTYLETKPASEFLQISKGYFQLLKKQHGIEPDAVVQTGTQGRPHYAYKVETLKRLAKEAHLHEKRH